MKQPKEINILVACEESQTIALAFRKLGFNAYSCDLEPCSGGHEEIHIQGDCFKAINSRKWDLIIAHPPCTHLAASGARWFNNPATPEKPRLQKEAIEFFLAFTKLDCEHVAIENPIGIMSRIYRKPDQIVQPYFFGDSARKSTCLWLKGLPLLVPDMIMDEGESFYWGEEGKRQPKWYREAWNLPPKERAKVRSKTFPGMARAIAEQWGKYLIDNL
ncbi:MAG: hypothetical protein IIY58_00215 [Aeriscardovia sp.]|nr:hypothetical protein [Aeriscardovia sp.]